MKSYKHTGGQPVSLRWRLRRNPSALGFSGHPLAKGFRTATDSVSGWQCPRKSQCPGIQGGPLAKDGALPQISETVLQPHTGDLRAVIQLMTMFMLCRGAPAHATNNRHQLQTSRICHIRRVTIPGISSLLLSSSNIMNVQIFSPGQQVRACQISR